ncbi:MAG: DUF1080 domain-containing protein [Bacteroidales bacterium]|nr:DUF1080 domain-containing protein [Bacteroidales bacterium]
MSKLLNYILPLFILSVIGCSTSNSEIVFDGTNLNNWDTSGNVSLSDSIMVIEGKNSKSILKNGNFRDFELNAVIRTINNGKGVLTFHTDNSGKGYSIAINNNKDDQQWWKMTGSLLSVRNIIKCFVEDGQWFNLTLRVEGNLISTYINDINVVNYIEPNEPYRTQANSKMLLSQGTFFFENCNDGKLEIKNVSAKKIDREMINIQGQLEVAQDETNDKIIRLHQEDFPVLNAHVHLKGRLTKETAAKQSLNTGINYAVAPNCGIGFPITNEEDIKNYIDTMSTQPFILAMQGEGREWKDTFSKESRDKFDFVFTDAMTFNDHRNKRIHLWVKDEVVIDNEQKYMDMIVDRTCDVLKEPADVYVNPFYLPDALQEKYDELWTEERIDKVIAALVESKEALEINELYNIPSKKIILKAKNAGIKFTFGSNNIDSNIGKLDYSIKMKEECGLTSIDMYKPKQRK